VDNLIIIQFCSIIKIIIITTRICCGKSNCGLSSKFRCRRASAVEVLKAFFIFIAYWVGSDSNASFLFTVDFLHSGEED
jgi:hypothetical protein